MVLDIYFIRHAQSEMNLKKELICGHSLETPLTQLGVNQALKLGKRLKRDNIKFDEIYSSTAKRTQQTAHFAGVTAGYSIENLVTTEQLLELHMGEWEGKQRNLIYTPQVIEKINSDNWNFSSPGGESQRVVEERMYGWVGTLLPRYEENLSVGVFSHGLAIRCLIRGILNTPASQTHKQPMKNTALTHIRYSGNELELMSVNDARHLTS